jgi:hypothetical protein
MYQNDNLFFREGDFSDKIDVTQATASDVLKLEQVEIMSREFPLEGKAIRDMIKDQDTYCLKILLNYKIIGWAAFGVDGDDIHVWRLAIKPSDKLAFLIQALFDAVTYTPSPPGVTPRRPTCHVDWPEHDPDHYVVKQLLADGWFITGLEPKMFYGYGQWWDGIKLERTF